jgi:hypothetical protein
LFYYFNCFLGRSTVAVADFDDSDEDESGVVNPDPPISDSSEQPTDDPAPLLDPRPPNPAPAAVLAVMPTTSKAHSARIRLFKPTVDVDSNKETRSKQEREKRQGKRGALVHRLRSEAHNESQLLQLPRTSDAAFITRMEEEGEKLEKSMAAALELPPLPVDSWELEEEEKGEESGDSINTADMMNDNMHVCEEEDI